MPDRALTDAAIADVTTPAPTDVLYIVTDPAGTPTDGRIEVQNLVTSPSPLLAYTIWPGAGTDLQTYSTSFVAIDAVNIPALALDLDVGDVVALRLRVTLAMDSSGNTMGLDWLIDRPVSGDTNLRGTRHSAHAWEAPTTGFDGQTQNAHGLFVATEAGTHTFLPQWKTNGQRGWLMLGGGLTTPVEHIVMRIATA